MSFADLGISKPVVRALAERDITEPFPVQKMVINDALAGHDLLVQSPTGSGKTLAFGVPLVDLIEPGRAAVSALVLAPTRELASQIVDELDSVARARNLRIAAVYGGVGFGPQSAAARARRHRRRHARPARGPDRARRRLARPRPDPRPRRGRPDARHGLQAGGQPDRRPDPGRAPDPLLLGDAGGRDRQARRRLHAQAAPPHPGAARAPGNADDRASLRPRRVAGRQARPADRGARSGGRRAHARLRPHQARRGPAGQAAAQPRRRRRRHARRQEPAPARTGAGPLRERRSRRP